MSEAEQLERDEAELRDIKEMCQTPGWVAFSRRHKELAQDMRLNGWNSVKTSDQLHYTKGYIEALESVANYENLIVAAEQETNVIPS